MKWKPFEAVVCTPSGSAVRQLRSGTEVPAMAEVKEAIERAVEKARRGEYVECYGLMPCAIREVQRGNPLMILAVALGSLFVIYTCVNFMKPEKPIYAAVEKSG